jgi:hypothetical protein
VDGSLVAFKELNAPAAKSTEEGTLVHRAAEAIRAEIDA